MGALWIEIALVLVLILVNAVLAGSEMAFVTLRDTQIDRLARSGSKGAAAARLARDPNRFLATVQVGITLAGFLASATAAVSIAEPLVEPFGALGRAAEPVAVILVTIVLAFLSLVLGELAPKRVALQRAEGWATVFARPLTVASALARPVVWALSHSTDLVVRLMGGDPAVRREELSKEELREMIGSRRGFHSIERTIMSGALEIADRSLREIAVPRTSITSVGADQAAERAIELLQAAGVSRAPVTGENIDDIVGIVHLRDLIGKQGPVERFKRDAMVLPEMLSVMKALAQMQRKRTQLAIVTDEYGGTEGLVTIEDILEEVVGEIYDEFDPDIATVTRRSDGSTELPGSFPIHDARDVGIALPEGDYATISGLMMQRLGRMPRRGDIVTEGKWRIEALRVKGRSVDRVRITEAVDRQEQPEEGAS